MALMLAAIAAACTAAGAPPQAAATEAAAPAAASAEIVFWVAGLDGNESLLDDQLVRFQDATGIVVKMEVLPPDSANFKDKLLAAIAAGTPPDLVGVWLGWFSKQPIDQLFTPLLKIDPELNMEVFTAGAQTASRFNDEVYGLPWTQYLCIPDFRLLWIPQGSAAQQEAYTLAAYLTAAEQQIENYAKVPTWYPTLTAVNDPPTGPGCTDTGTVMRWPSSEEQAVIRSAIEPDLQEVEKSLRVNGYWPDDQPTTLDFERTVGVGTGEAQDGSAEAFGEVRVGAAPVGTTDPEFFLESNLLDYFASTGKEYIIVGAVEVFDPEVFDNAVPSGAYAIAWRHAKDDTESDQLVLLDADGNKVYENSNLYALFGTNPPQPDPAAEITQPFAAMQQGSWELCVYWDKRKACLP
jgi:hypothetical protein